MEYKSGLTGLSSGEAFKKLDVYGRNRVERIRGRGAMTILLSQISNYLVWLLLIAAGISYFLGQSLDALVIFLTVGVSALFGFLQEFRAEKTIEALHKYISHKVRVERDGVWREVDSADLVPGDKVSFRMGDRVPADIKLIVSKNLEIDEGVLTGESLSVVKDLRTNNRLFAGTYVVEGSGEGVVEHTGKQTEFGKIEMSLEKRQPESHFQKQIRRFGKMLSVVILVMTLFVFGVNSFANKGILESLLFSVALAVGVAPELLPMIITVTLSYGARNMAKKKVVAKRLSSVEDFGNIDTLCTDKTGTITQGDFSVQKYRSLVGGDDKEVLIKALVCSSGFVGSGAAENQVDLALWKSVNEVTGEVQKYKLVESEEFDFRKRMMKVIAEKQGVNFLIVKGSVDTVLEICDVSNQVRQKMIKEVADIETRGVRVILVAQKEIGNVKVIRSTQKMNLLGLIYFTDQLKKGAKEAVKKFESLGVRIKILSGDSAEVVRRVALESGLSKEVVLVGSDLEKMSVLEFEKTVFENNLFARLSPEQKEKIVSVLNVEGHVVGYLGDGVNDAPSLRAADVGISVDSGVEVAKEASDIVLLDKDLAVLSEGIVMGRRTFGNVTKYILNTISANFGNMFTVAISSIFLPFIPLLPTQILLNNFLSDIPLLALPGDNVDSSFVRRPRQWNFELIVKFMMYFGFISSMFDLAMVLPMYMLWHVSPEVFRTAWFVESSLSEMAITFSIRTYMSIFKSKPGIWLIVLSLISMVAVLVLPMTLVGRYAFSFVELPIYVIVWTGVVVSLYFLTTEYVKQRFFKKYSF